MYIQTVKKSPEKTSKGTLHLYKQLLLLMRCKIIKLPVLKFRAKCVKTSINKEQRFPETSNVNDFDTLMRNIRLGSLKECTTYWKHITCRILSASLHRNRNYSAILATLQITSYADKYNYSVDKLVTWKFDKVIF
jgi:hypothetical protein